MIKALWKSFFPNRKRVIIILLQPPGQSMKHFLFHEDEEMFFLDKGENISTYARSIIRQGFKYIHHDDIHLDEYKNFEQDGVEYYLVTFDEPFIPEEGVDGYQKFEKAGFEFLMIGDHPLAPKIKKAIGQK